MPTSIRVHHGDNDVDPRRGCVPPGRAPPRYPHHYHDRGEHLQPAPPGAGGASGSHSRHQRRHTDVIPSQLLHLLWHEQTVPRDVQGGLLFQPLSIIAPLGYCREQGREGNNAFVGETA